MGFAGSGAVTFLPLRAGRRGSRSDRIGDSAASPDYRSAAHLYDQRPADQPLGTLQGVPVVGMLNVAVVLLLLSRMDQTISFTVSPLR